MMRRLLRTSVRATFTVTLGIAAIAYFCAPLFVSLFIKGNAEAMDMAVRAVKCYALGMPLYGLNLIYLNYFQGIGKSELSAISGFLSESGFQILSAFAMAPFFGAEAIWLSFPVSQVLMFIYYGILLFFKTRRLRINHKKLWDRVLLLPLSFDVDEKDRIDISIDQMDEVVELSRRAWNFCKEHNCDRKRCYMVSLSVEELAGNVIKHGFVDKKKHTIDVRIIKKDDDYYLRFRDDCLIFDPLKQLPLYSEDDLVYHIGLRMIIKRSKEMHYTCMLKLNNLLVRI